MTESHHDRIERYLTEGRTVSGGKGDNVAKSTERSQAAFNSLLQSAFKTTFGENQAILGRIDSIFKGIIANPQGFTPTTLAALNTNNTERTATDYQNATKAAQATMAARGTGLPSGVNAQVEGQIAAAAAGEESSGQRQIALVNEQQRQSNFWNALSGEERVAAADSPLGFGSESNSSAGTVANLSQAYTQSQGPGIGAVLGGIAGGAATAALGPGGAFTKALNG